MKNEQMQPEEQADKNEEQPAIKQSGIQLRRVLGLRETVALGIGGTIGGAIFVLVGVAIRQAGPGVLLSFSLAFLTTLFIALPYIELACRYPLAGGSYAFIREVLGHHCGFGMGWVYGGAYLFISGYVSLGFGAYLRALLGVPQLVGTLTLILVIVVINLIGAQLFTRVQSVVVALVVIALVGFGVVGLPHVQFSHFSPFLPNGLGGVLVAAPLMFLASSGFDAMVTASEEIKSPERTLPRALLLTLGIVFVLYALVIFVSVGVLPSNALGSSAPLARAAALVLGPVGRRFIAASATLATAAMENAILVITSRVTFAMARDGLLPRLLARVHPRTGIPWVAVVANGVLLVLIALLGSVPSAAEVGGFFYVLHYAFALVGFIVLRYRQKTTATFHTPAPHLVLPLALGGCLLLLVASGGTGITISLGWLAGGLIIYGSTLLIRLAWRRGIRWRRAREIPDQEPCKELCFDLADLPTKRWQAIQLRSSFRKPRRVQLLPMDGIDIDSVEWQPKGVLIPSMSSIPASSMRVSLSEEHLEITFKGDKIASLATEEGPEGGVPGILRQVGVRLPTP